MCCEEVIRFLIKQLWNLPFLFVSFEMVVETILYFHPFKKPER